MVRHIIICTEEPSFNFYKPKHKTFCYSLIVLSKCKQQLYKNTITKYTHVLSYKPLLIFIT